MKVEMNKSVSIIILNWNNYKDTIECVESCLKLDYSPYEIVIVDNASEDDSENILRNFFPCLRLIQTGSNLGFAGGNNAGIRYALEKDSDFIWLVNNDAVVDPHALSLLVACADANPSIGMVGSKILSYSEPFLLLSAGGTVDMRTGVTEHIGFGCTDKGQFDQPLDTGYLTGCSLLVRRKVIEDIGLMNENYFLYFEETEWCVKAKNKGYKLRYAPESVVYHKESVSVRKIKGALYYYLTRNRLYFIQRNGTKVQWRKRFASDLYTLVGFLLRKEIPAACCILRAYWHWIGGYMGPLHALTRSSPHLH
jgi:GT2 family glycosyltransferase